MKHLLIALPLFLFQNSFAQFTTEDSLKSISLEKDWRGNAWVKYKVPDTSIVQIKVYDKDGYVKRIQAYRLVGGKELIMAEGDVVYINVNWNYTDVSYLYMDKTPIKPTDIDSLF